MNENYKEEIIRLQSELDEADRQAGKAMRELANLRDTDVKRKDWLRKAKSEAGYSDNISFDVVWDNLNHEHQEQKELLFKIKELLSTDTNANANVSHAYSLLSKFFSEK